MEAEQFTLQIESFRRRFEEKFRRQASWACFAPGRINLIGEHVDYQAGLVLPGAIQVGTWVLAAQRDDQQLQVYSQGFGHELLQRDQFTARGNWLDFVQGAHRALQVSCAGLPGFDLLIDGELPMGMGLSSSASLCVALLLAMSKVAGSDLPQWELIDLARQAEGLFAGVSCGVMDPAAIVLGEEEHLIRLDCHTHETRSIAFPFESGSLLVLDSGIHRELRDGRYQERREEGELALSILKQKGLIQQNVRYWREVSAEKLASFEAALPVALFRRVRHYFTENQRVEACCQALNQADLPLVGELLNQSMASLRDDYEVSVPKMDQIYEIVSEEKGVYGARMMGAGFGGSLLVLVDSLQVESVKKRILSALEQKRGCRYALLEAKLSNGARVFPL